MSADAQVGDVEWTVAALVARAGAGEQEAWNRLVERFSPLVVSVCRRFGLGDADLLDVGQCVWLRLVEHLATLREAEALPGWIATTTRRECLHLVTGKGGRQRLELVGDVEVTTRDGADDPDRVADLLLAAERQAALRVAFASLSPQHQQLLVLLLRDPPLSYAEIAGRLDVPVGSIGPTRGRCLARLRGHPAMRALADAPTDAPLRETGRSR